MILNFISATSGTDEEGEFSPENLRSWLSSLSAADATGTARALIDRLVSRSDGVPLWLVVSNHEIVEQRFGVTEWRASILPTIKSLLP